MQAMTMPTAGPAGLAGADLIERAMQLRSALGQDAAAEPAADPIPVGQATEVLCWGWRGPQMRAAVCCDSCAHRTDVMLAGVPVMMVPPPPERRGLTVLGCPLFLHRSRVNPGQCS